MMAVAALAAGGAGAIAETSADAILDGMPPSFSGSYLAGRSADTARDINAAIAFYGNALQADADNPALMERLLLLSLAGGKMEDAFALAKRLVVFDAGNPAGRLALAVQALKAHQPEIATVELGKIGPAELATLTAGLINAWIQFDAGKVDEALKTIAALTGPEWYAIFKDFHTALILDAAGRKDEAVAAISKAYGDDATALRILVSYARILTRAGKADAAIRALMLAGGEEPRHPELRTLLADIKAGKALSPLVATMETGVAEALYGLGSAIGTDEGPELPAAYLRLSAYLDVGNYLSTVAVGDVFQSVKRCDEAIAVYDTVPKAANIRRNADIQTSVCLAQMEKPDEAAKYVQRVVDADPGDVEAAMELGNIYRGSDRFAEAVDAYTLAINKMKADQPATVASPGRRTTGDWRVYYFRGVALERSKRWPEAEADFKQALAISPEQPPVLNYLGYSWVDQGLNLDDALTMIKKAVALSPNDGYIVDSLGWAYYRLGRGKDAVATLESASQLRGGDATINDHLGDAYWEVGRKREALFQWAHARDAKPDKEQLPKILAKLERGLGAEPASGTTGANSVRVEKGESLWAIAARVYGDPGQYSRIFEANKERIGNPNVIFPGMTLDIPPGKVN